VFQL
jgi:hypothetical protein